MSAAQVAAGAAIVAWAADVHDFPLTGPVEHGKPGVTTHCHPNGQPDPAWGDHTCPGTIRLAQVPELIAQAVAIDKPPAPPVKKENPPMVIIVGPISPGVNAEWTWDGGKECVHIVTGPTATNLGAAGIPTVDIDSGTFDLLTKVS
jgi:hypothetical protein